MTDAERVQRIAQRYQQWVHDHDKAAKHVRGCRQCKTVDDERVLCPQAPPFPPFDDFADLRDNR